MLYRRSLKKLFSGTVLLTSIKIKHLDLGFGHSPVIAIRFLIIKKLPFDTVIEDLCLHSALPLFCAFRNVLKSSVLLRLTAKITPTV